MSAMLRCLADGFMQPFRDLRRVWCWLAYHLWIRLSLDWQATRFGLWLLPYCGEYAFAPDEAPEGRSHESR